MQELLEESNTLLEKMSTETGRAPTPTVRTFQFLFVQFACFGFLLSFPLSLTFLLPVFFVYSFCFAINFFSLFALLRYGLFVENTCYKTEGEWKVGHFLLLSHSFRGHASIRQSFFDLKKKQLVRTRWSNVNILEIQFKCTSSYLHFAELGHHAQIRSRTEKRKS